MITKVSKIKKFKSYFYPVLIDEKKGDLLPIIEVNLRKGKFVLDGKNVNYSFGSLHTVFRKSFDEFNLKNKKIKNVLILGFGAGSVAHILKNEYNLDCKIHGVELDKVVFEFSKKYFNANKLSNTELFCDDAFNFLLNNNDSYDLIIVDLFVEDNVPVKFLKRDFAILLDKHLQENGFLFFNKVNNTIKKQLETSRMKIDFEVEFKKKIEVFSINSQNCENAILVYNKSV